MIIKEAKRMTIIEALKISKIIRRLSWEEGYLFVLDEDVEIDSDDYWYDDTTYEDYLADDWIALVPTTKPKQETHNNQLYNVIDKPL